MLCSSSSSTDAPDRMTFEYWIVHRQESNMTGQCVIHAGNSRFMESVGNVPSAIIMIYARYAIILISIICVIDSIGSRKGKLKFFVFDKVFEFRSVWLSRNQWDFCYAGLVLPAVGTA